MPTTRYALPALSLLALFGQQAQAGGIMLYEIGTDTVGRATAGAAARLRAPPPSPATQPA